MMQPLPPLPRLQVPCGNASALEMYDSSSHWLTVFVCDTEAWRELLLYYEPNLTVLQSQLLCCSKPNSSSVAKPPPLF